MSLFPWGKSRGQGDEIPFQAHGGRESLWRLSIVAGLFFEYQLFAQTAAGTALHPEGP
jgi:hypothetical protein